MARPKLAYTLEGLKRYISGIIDDYDNGKLTLGDAKDRINNMCKDALCTTYDSAFAEGIESAELDDDPDEEIEFEIEEGDDDVDYHD